MIASLDKKRESDAELDKALLEDLIEMHADMCMALDLTKDICPDENPEKNALMRYEVTLSASIRRLKRLSPHLN